MSPRALLLQQLREVVAQLRLCDRGGRTPRDIACELVDMRHTADLLELEFAHTAAEFERTDEYDRAGYDTPIQWLRNECHTSTGVACNAMAVGRHLDDMRGSIASLQTGEIGFQHVALMAHTAEHLESGGRGGTFDEQPLLTKARGHDVTRFRKDCAHARHAADARQFLDEHRNAVEERFLEVSARDDGCVWLRGFLDSVAGASLRSALGTLATRSGADDTRAVTRRYADALVELVDQALESGRCHLPGGIRPHVQVTVALDTLQDIAGADAAEMEFAGAVPAATAQRAACDARITRVLLDSNSLVTDVGRSRRVPAAATRRALAMRDGGCVWPGCDRPPSWTQAHHIVHWVSGGLTEPANLVLLCRRHHWKLHEGGWQMSRATDGGITVVPPLPGYTPQARAPAAAAA